MSFSWTPHRFTGGALALDVANSVIMRHDETRRIDRFAHPENLKRFAIAASELSRDGPTLGPFQAVDAQNESQFIALREAIDAFYRARAIGDETLHLEATLLERIAHTFRLYASQPGSTAIDLATARSALQVLAMADPQRLKICGNCGWLFIDRSKNKSRTWCDMTVCGNRTKSRLHYARKTMGEAQ